MKSEAGSVKRGAPLGPDGVWGIGFVFSGGWQWDMEVRLCTIRSWGGFGVFEIGFVLYSVKPPGGRREE